METKCLFAAVRTSQSGDPYLFANEMARDAFVAHYSDASACMTLLVDHEVLTAAREFFADHPDRINSPY